MAKIYKTKVTTVSNVETTGTTELHSTLTALLPTPTLPSKTKRN